MKKIIIVFFLLGITFANGQEIDSVKSIKPLKGSTNDSIVIFKPKIEGFKYWTNDQSPEIIDTTLSISNFYNQNFIRRDAFAKLFFPNVGGVVVDLEYKNSPFSTSMLPTGKKYNYYRAEDINYYDVKNPYTELIYENGVKQGNFLSSKFSHNINKQFNYTFHYRGLLSQGRYQNENAQNNTFIFSSNYKTKSERFKLWWHYAAQNLKNNENEGIQEIDDFILQKERRLTNVTNIPVNSLTAKSEFDSRRIQINTSYGILKRMNKTDSTFYNPIILKNTFTYEKQKFRFIDSSPNGELYSTPIISSIDPNTLKSSTDLSDVITAGFNWTERIQIEAGLKFQNYRIFSNEALKWSSTSATGTVYSVDSPQEMKENLFGFVGKVNFDWTKAVRLKGDVEYLNSSNYNSVYNIDAILDLNILKGYTLSVGGLIQSKIPSLNMIYNQSFFANFNYDNKFKTINTQNIFSKLNIEKIHTVLEGSLYNINDYVYLDSNFNYKQLDEQIKYFKFKIYNHLKYQNFNLVSTIQYQKVTKNEDCMPLPKFLIRETLYWQGKLFKNKAELQTGGNFTYFTKYNGLRYIPILNEFALQSPDNIQQIGGYPILDLFINFKVRNMRFYIRGEHINALLTKKPNYFASPDVPYKGFKFQIGIKWNIFS